MNQQFKKDVEAYLSKQEVELLKQSIMEDVKFVQPLPKEYKKKSPKRVMPLVFAMAMSFVCIFAFIQMRPMATISIDVNPAIELTVNKKERITNIVLHNEQAKQIVGDMELKNVDVEVAVHAIIGKMFQQGYLTNSKNSMLLTVQSDDINYRSQLKDMLLRDIETSYSIYETPIALLSQELTYHSDYENLAKQYNISEGKASLIMEVLTDYPEYEFASFVNMSIQDIQTFMHYKNISYKSITAQGVESHDGYLTLEEIRKIIENHAKISVTKFDYELECDDNRLVYEIDVIDGTVAYEYEINAISGEIIDFDIEVKK